VIDRLTVARRTPHSSRALLLASCPCEGVDEFARFEFRRIYDYGFAGLAELADVICLKILILHEQDSRPFPFADRTEFYIANDGIERRLVQVFCEFGLIDNSDGADRLRQDLHLRVGERRPKSERVDAGAGGPLLILVKNIFDAGKFHRGFRHVVFIDNDAVK
jgi:hypothetical protein